MKAKGWTHSKRREMEVRNATMQESPKYPAKRVFFINFEEHLKIRGDLGQM